MLIDVRGKRRPQAVRTKSSLSPTDVIATCHMERCKAPVTSSAEMAEANFGGLASREEDSDDDELDSEESEEASSHCGSLSSGASASSGMTSWAKN